MEGMLFLLLIFATVMEMGRDGAGSLGFPFWGLVKRLLGAHLFARLARQGSFSVASGLSCPWHSCCQPSPGTGALAVCGVQPPTWMAALSGEQAGKWHDLLKRNLWGACCSVLVLSTHVS